MAQIERLSIINISSFSQPAECRFDLNLDPQENTNLAQNEQYQSKIQQYRHLVQESVQQLA